MSNKKSRFKPVVQPLETRRLLAGDVAAEVGATTEEPARDDTVVPAASIGGYSADVGGGGLFQTTDQARDEIFAEKGRENSGRGYEGQIDMLYWSW